MLTRKSWNDSTCVHPRALRQTWVDPRGSLSSQPSGVQYRFNERPYLRNKNGGTVEEVIPMATSG